MKTFTFWKGVYNKQELSEYVEKNGDCPESEMFLKKSKGDDELIKRFGFIESIPSDFDDEELEEIPKTLTEALNL